MDEARRPRDSLPLGSRTRPPGRDELAEVTAARLHLDSALADWHRFGTPQHLRSTTAVVRELCSAAVHLRDTAARLAASTGGETLWWVAGLAPIARTVSVGAHAVANGFGRDGDQTAFGITSMNAGRDRLRGLVLDMAGSAQAHDRALTDGASHSEVRGIDPPG